MHYAIKGICLGIFFLIAFTLIIAPMTNELKETTHRINCNYSCSVKELVNTYNNILIIPLLCIFLFLGITISRLSWLITTKDKNDTNKREGYRWLWEHKLKTVED